ncbi:MAG: hypothetical protein J6L71_04355 [Clostridia bacterium]|nr:hypothetical protein [Clostridia bacterium]
MRLSFTWSSASVRGSIIDTILRLIASASAPTASISNLIESSRDANLLLVASPPASEANGVTRTSNPVESNPESPPQTSLHTARGETVRLPLGDTSVIS